jgi:hypothetical protein
MSPRHRDPIPLPDDDDREYEISRDNREIEPSFDEPSGKHGVGAVVLHHTVTAVLVAVVLLTSLWSYYQFRQTSFFTLTSEADRSAFEVYAVDAQKDRISFALEVYEKLFDEFPSSLETLIDEGLLQESDLFYPSGGRNFSYQRMGRSYQLEWVAPKGPGPKGEIVEDTPEGNQAESPDRKGEPPETTDDNSEKK